MMALRFGVGELILEVQQQLGDGIVRTIAMGKFRRFEAWP